MAARMLKCSFQSGSDAGGVGVFVMGVSMSWKLLGDAGKMLEGCVHVS